MPDPKWSRGPYGLDADKGATARGLKKVLAVIHHLTSATRLADVLPLVERDLRVQVVFTVSPASVLAGGAADHARRLGAVMIPWQQAVHTPFDLALAAGHGGLEHLHAPVLSLPHGIGPSTLMHRWKGFGLPVSRPLAGLRAESIVAGGRVIPSVIALAHEAHRDLLGRSCPEALPAVVIAGDPTYDRMTASVRLRQSFRDALDVAPGQCLVVVSSTWGPRSLLGRVPDLPLRLATQLSARTHKIVVALHPNVWTWHGRRQIAAWYTDCTRLGVRFLRPEEGWGAALAAADRLIGDHGSATCYGAALGLPVLLGAFPDEDVMPGSAVGLLGRRAPRLDTERPLRPQLEAARGFTSGEREAFQRMLTAKPGASATILRGVMYRLLGLPEPDEPARTEPLPPPRPLWTDAADTRWADR